MNTDDTRQLGIEFERRVQQMLPQKEFLDKMDTETIYSFLNQYQDKLIHELFKTVDSLQPETKSPRIDALLNNLLVVTDLALISQGNDSMWKLVCSGESALPKMAVYVSSISEVNSYFMKGKNHATSSVRVQNKYVPVSEFSKYEIAPNDTLRIMRTPVITFSYIDDHKDEVFSIIHDKYTTIGSVELTYYRNPKYFDWKKGNECELPIDMFDELVSGAVALYIQYIAGQQNQQEKKEDKGD